MMAENRREKEEAKKETENKAPPHKDCIQQKRYEDYQKFQYCMDSLY